MPSFKLQAGKQFPNITVEKLSGGEIKLGQPMRNATWQMIVVYRGKHCPLCTKYLTQLQSLDESFLNAGVDTIIVSADNRDKAQKHIVDDLNLTFEVGFDLSIEQMQTLGLYVSHPRSPTETDKPFSEPGIFVVNENSLLHVVDISNNPFVRPELEQLLSGIKWIRDPKNNYPIRGTFE